jgi:hypothetical protein
LFLRVAEPILVSGCVFHKKDELAAPTWLDHRQR